ncbi:T-cell surface glycoprotein CD3 zeta chain [Pseudophryne corroboree]|uniref:T-cell surface glycoprotein CD3 zeta chain n=1 Tax=Pseudophryne corroboree TaxID=495146 RepID=UPI0030815F51
MKSSWIAVSAFLQAQVSLTDAQVFGWTDPRICYILDGILFIYAIIITALLFRERFVKRPPVPGEESYSDLKYGDQGGYDKMNLGANAQTRGKRGNAKAQDNSVYHDLQKDKRNESYSDIRVKKQPVKKGKGNEALYQGLSGAQRDTYNVLQMQPLH